MFLRAKWRLSEYPGLHAPEEVICAIGRAEDDLLPFLEDWQAAEAPSAARHLVDLILYGVSSAKPALTNGFWDAERREQQDQVIA